ncbi:hypothetical protein H1R20_g15783, partial [Candolleomyces eurysporus]
MEGEGSANTPTPSVEDDIPYIQRLMTRRLPFLSRDIDEINHFISVGDMCMEELDTLTQDAEDCLSIFFHIEVLPSFLLAIPSRMMDIDGGNIYTDALERPIKPLPKELEEIERYLQAGPGHIESLKIDLGFANTNNQLEEVQRLSATLKVVSTNLANLRRLKGKKLSQASKPQVARTGKRRRHVQGNAEGHGEVALPPSLGRIDGGAGQAKRQRLSSDGHTGGPPQAVDSCISAQWPDREQNPLLFDTVLERMVHGPCGAANPNAPCMVNGKCSKRFPQEFNEETTMGENGYARMARPDNGVAFEVHGIWVDNRWIVAHPRALCAEFDCHINLECAISLASVRYSFKYLHKGPDRGSAEVSQDNEVKTYIDGRYISATDAVWRIFHFPIHEQHPPVVRLQIHLPGEQNVVYRDDQEINEVLAANANKRTTLTAFFEANADNGPAGDRARTLTYAELPHHFVWDQNTLKWKLQQIEVLDALMRKRAELAQLVGRPSYVLLTLDDKMAKTPGG